LGLDRELSQEREWSVKLKYMRQRRGMSLLEVVISISILAIVALSVVLAVTRIMVAQSSSSHHTVARLIAESELEKAVLLGQDGWDFSGNPPVDQAFAQVGQTTGDTEFRFQVFARWTSAQNEGGGDLFIAGPNMGGLAEIEVLIWWAADDTGPQAAVERGIQSLSVSRMVYDET
jgi:prepilin-type N-terminal cleavage/methylation domain-containing protein